MLQGMDSRPLKHLGKHCNASHQGMLLVRLLRDTFVHAHTGGGSTVQAEEWNRQLHRSQHNMRELAGSDPNTVLDTDFDLAASEMDTQIETASQTPGANTCLLALSKAVEFAEVMSPHMSSCACDKDFAFTGSVSKLLVI